MLMWCLLHTHAQDWIIECSQVQEESRNDVDEGIGKQNGITSL